MNITAIILLLLKASIILAVFAIGLKATFADATYLFRRPGRLWRALLSMNVLMPFVALTLAWAFDFHPAVKIALVAISVSPIPPIIPNKALKAGGRESYIIGLLVAAAVLSIVVIPLTMEVFERIAGVPLTMRAGPVAVLVLTTILAPLLVGIAVRRIAQTFAERAAKPVAAVAYVLLILSALPVLFGLLRASLALIGDGTILGLAGFALFGLVVGHLLGGPSPDDRHVLALATATRHPAVALAIAHANFPDQKLTGAAVFLFMLISAILFALYLSWARRRGAGSAPVETGKPTAA